MNDMVMFRAVPRQPRLFGEEWLDDGYVTTSVFDTPDMCSICQTPGNVCTGHDGPAEEPVQIIGPLHDYQQRLIES